jgi:hypothetical protein
MIHLQTVEPCLISAANWTWLQLWCSGWPPKFTKHWIMLLGVWRVCKGPRVITIPEHKASHIHILQDLFSMYICSADHAWPAAWSCCVQTKFKPRCQRNMGTDLPTGLVAWPKRFRHQVDGASSNYIGSPKVTVGVRVVHFRLLIPTV